MNPLSAMNRLFKLAKWARLDVLPRALLLAMLVLLSLPAAADSSVYSDVPLRTKNRAKPNILMFLDNGPNSDLTYTPSSFPSNLFATLSSKGSVYFDYNYSYYLSTSASSGVAQNYNNLATTPADDDWHYRSNDCTVSGSGSSVVVACPSGSTNFNRLYFNPSFTYSAPKKVDGSVSMPLPKDVFAAPTTYAWYVTGVTMNVGGTAAATTQLSTSPLYGCTLGNPSINTNTTWNYDNATMSDASGSKGTPLLSSDSLAISNFDTCAWIDGYNPQLGTVNLLKNFSTVPYPMDFRTIPPQNFPKLLASTLSTAYPVEVVRPDGIVQTQTQTVVPFSSGTTNVVFSCPPGYKPSAASAVNCTGTLSATLPYNNQYTPVMNDYSAQITSSNITSQWNFWYSSGCSTSRGATTCTSQYGPFATGVTNSAYPPTDAVSPYYCDLSLTTATTIPCTGATTFYANPGPADYFDSSGTRHPIVDWYCNGLLHSNGNANCGSGNGSAASVKFQIAWTRAQIWNFATWFSFSRTRLLSAKTSLASAVNNAGLNANFRVGLASLMDGQGNQGTLGSNSSTAHDYHYFSAVADFDSTHQAEWYGRLQKVQAMSGLISDADYPGGIHSAYLWFVGTYPDPVPPSSSFVSQLAANTTNNTGADSQYIQYQNSSGAWVNTGRSGPLMFSCQANVLVPILTDFTTIAGYSHTIVVPGLAGSGTCTDSYRAYTSGLGTSAPCDADYNGVFLPGYLSSSTKYYPTGCSSSSCQTTGLGSFSDATICGPTDTGACHGGTITYGAAAWPAPFYAPVNTHYTFSSNSPAVYQSSFAQLALYYWSRDLNEEFNRQKGSSIVPVDYPHDDKTGATGGGKQGVPVFGVDTAFWPHVTTYMVNLGIAGQYDYGSSGSSNPITRAGSSGHLDWPVPTFSGTATYQTFLDDMVHAAAAGHGQFISAYDSSTLNTAFATLFTDILQLAGSESAVAVANTQVSQTGTSYAFQSSYNTFRWSGELVASPISSSTGVITTYSLAAASANPKTTCSASAGAGSGWSAMCQLRNTLCPSYLPNNGCAATPGANNATARVIATNTPTGAGIPFTYSDLNTAGLASQLKYYATDASSAAAYLHGNDTNAASVISFIRGDATNENCSSTTSGYRCRYRNGNTIDYWFPLGDIVDAEAVVIGPPQTSYDETTNPGYSAWRTSTGVGDRSPVVFQATNDGMLHAFLVSSGVENWAYVPGYVLPSLKQLANPSYSHQYYVNATPTFGDVYYSSAWHTILVGGLGKGGRGYYALDVTTPTAGTESAAASKVLWTFPHPDGSSDVTGVCVNTVANMGYTYGRPAIVKVSVAGTPTWVVLLTSGYNNGYLNGSTASSPTSLDGDGIGHLYVLNAGTGVCLADITTTSGSQAAPSGLAYISAKVANTNTDLTVQAAYAGDLNGNVWKFAPSAPTTSTNLSTWTATQFALLKDSSSSHKPQPVTSEPNIAVIGSTTMVFVGTGRYLGTNDVPASANFKTDTNYVGQSMYGLMDDGVTTYLNATSGVRAAISSGNIINGDCTDSGGGTISANSCSFSSSYCAVPSSATRCFSSGLQSTLLASQTSVHSWVFDLPMGERVITNPVIALGSLLFTSNQPVADPCQPGGQSFFYILDYKTGGMASGASSVAQAILDPVSGNSVMASRPTLIQLADGRVIGLVSTSVGATLQISNILSQSARRVSWREVPN